MRRLDADVRSERRLERRGARPAAEPAGGEDLRQRVQFRRTDGRLEYVYHLYLLQLAAWRDPARRRDGQRLPVTNSTMDEAT
ncbi:hypothetical protein ABZ949_10975 [Micromonospora tulbaghiae]|uniref:hypothetical protein n=1 Tax=Micromonospora tulbaghiae TaxID=479978 RepID=UPI0033FECF24